MMQAAPADVSKDQVFKLRLGAEDRERLDELADHYSATAATVVRILIKEKHDALKLDGAVFEREDFREEHEAVLATIKAFASGDRIAGAKLHHDDFARELYERLEGQSLGLAGINRVVNSLVRWGYLQRFRGRVSGVITFALTGKK